MSETRGATGPGGSPEGGTGRGGTEDGGDGRPPALRDLSEDRIEDVDVRAQLRRGEEPFQRIMTAAAGLSPDGVLRVRAIFEPVPLYSVMAGRGFRHWTERLGEEDWRVWFYRPRGREADGPTGSGRDARRAGDTTTRTEGTKMDTAGGTDADRTTRRGGPPRPPESEEGARQGPFLLDVRKLDGPEKHPTIHRAFDALEPGQVLTIVNDHQPKPLYYELVAERPDSFDAENYRAYEAGDRVWVAVLPRSFQGPASGFSRG